jgi:hypothetical protein
MAGDIAMGNHNISGTGIINATTFNGALSGNAATATKLAASTTINGQSFDGSAPITITIDAGALTGDTLAAGVTASSLTSVGVLNGLTMSNNIAMGGHDITGATNIYATTFHGALSGNAATATALQTARNINGIPFNGSVDITVPAAAVTLTGDTLATNIVHSSLTGVGMLTALNMGGNITLNNHNITGVGTISATTLSATGLINANGGISTTTGALNLNSTTGFINFNNTLDVVFQNGGDVNFNNIGAANFNGFINANGGINTTGGNNLSLKSESGNVDFDNFSADVYFNFNNLHSIGSMEVDNWGTPVWTVDNGGNTAISGTLQVGGTSPGLGFAILNPTFTVDTAGNTMVGGTLYADGGINTDSGNLSLSSSGGNVVPGGTQNLGSPGSQWQNLYVSGTADVGSLSIGGGATITKHLSAATTWDPADLNDVGSPAATPFTTKAVTVTGAAVGDTVVVGFDQPIPNGCTLTGAVTALNIVTVTLVNNSATDVNLVSGNLRADVWQH